MTFTLVDRELWLTSTLYLLDGTLRDALGASAEVIEFGYTAKLLALAAVLHADDVGIRLPSTAAVPAVGVVARAEPDEETASAFAARGPQWEHLRAPYRRALRTIRRGESPACVLVDEQRRDQLYRRVDDWTFEVERGQLARAVDSALRAHDEHLWHEALEQQCPLLAAEGGAEARLEPDYVTSLDPGWHELGVVASANFSNGAERTGSRLLAREKRLY